MGDRQGNQAGAVDVTKLEDMRTDIAVPVREMSRIPVISAEQYGHLGKYAGALVASAFEQMGGLPMLVDWATQNRTDFYTKIWSKTIQRSQQVEHGGTITIDDAITRLERMDEAEYTEVAAHDL